MIPHKWPIHGVSLLYKFSDTDFMTLDKLFIGAWGLSSEKNGNIAME